MMSEKPSGDVVGQNIDLAFEFIRGTIDDPKVIEGARDGVTFVLVPDDDPKLAERNIQVGVDAVRAGKDVYFVHVPASAQPSQPVGSRLS